MPKPASLTKYRYDYPLFTQGTYVEKQRGAPFLGAAANMPREGVFWVGAVKYAHEDLYQRDPRVYLALYPAVYDGFAERWCRRPDRHHCVLRLSDMDGQFGARLFRGAGYRSGTYIADLLQGWLELNESSHLLDWSRKTDLNNILRSFAEKGFASAGALDFGAEQKEDVLNDVFVQLFGDTSTMLQNFDPDRDFLKYLATILRRKVQSVAQKYRTPEKYFDYNAPSTNFPGSPDGSDDYLPPNYAGDPSDDPQYGLEYDDTLQFLRQELANHPSDPNGWFLKFLSDDDVFDRGTTYKEIAEHFGVSAGFISQHYKKLLAAIREIAAEHGLRELETMVDSMQEKLRRTRNADRRHRRATAFREDEEQFPLAVDALNAYRARNDPYVPVGDLARIRRTVVSDPTSLERLLLRDGSVESLSHEDMVEEMADLLERADTDYVQRTDGQLSALTHLTHVDGSDPAQYDY